GRGARRPRCPAGCRRGSLCSLDPSVAEGPDIPRTGPSTDQPGTVTDRVGRRWHNGGMVKQQHPWSRYVALGDSFAEGIGDPEPTVPGGNRGWADRVAEVLSQGTEDFAYANLAVR